MTSDASGLRARSVAAHIGRTAAIIGALAVAARMVGVLRVFAQTSVLGTTALGDAYISANKIPNIVFDVVAGGALSSVIIPVLAGPMAAGDRAATRRIASALLTWTVAILLPLSVLGMLASRPLMSALLAGVSDAGERQGKIDVGARMLVVFMPQLILYGVGIVLTGVLQAHRRFVAPAIAPLLSSVVVIAAYLAYAAQAGGDRSLTALSRTEELTLSAGTTLGVAALTLPLLVPVRRLRLGLRPALRMPAGAGSHIRQLALAGAVGLGAQQIATLVVIFLANREPGALVVYELAWTIFLVPWAVLAVPIATSAFPVLTAAAAAGDEPAYAAATAAALRATLLAMWAGAAMLVGAARPAASLLLVLAPGTDAGVGAGELALALAAFAPGLIGYGLLALLTRAAYARNEGRAAATAAAAGFAVTALIDVLLVALVPRDWLVAALGLGNTVGMTVAALLLLGWLRRSAGSAALAGAPRFAAVGAAGFLLAGASGAAVARLLPSGDAPAAALAALCAVVGTVAVLATVAIVGLRGQLGSPLQRPLAKDGRT